MMAAMKTPQAIFFDFDGTLADTAPDLAGTANDMRTARGLEPLPYESLRPYASAGARGLVGAAFALEPGHSDYESHKTEFLQRYELRMTRETTVFDEVYELLSALEARGLLWGIVTNKVSRFTIPIVKHLNLHQRAAAVVSGDTTPHAKPHPAPLLKAAEDADVAPVQCWYVGDDLRDIQAARAASMAAVAAAYGYCGNSDVARWQADRIITTPLQLLKLLP
jgi:phosphoglycolate phosphatase